MITTGDEGPCVPPAPLSLVDPNALALVPVVSRTSSRASIFEGLEDLIEDDTLDEDDDCDEVISSIFPKPSIATVNPLATFGAPRKKTDPFVSVAPCCPTTGIEVDPTDLQEVMRSPPLNPGWHDISINAKKPKGTGGATSQGKRQRKSQGKSRGQGRGKGRGGEGKRGEGYSEPTTPQKTKPTTCTSTRKSRNPESKVILNKLHRCAIIIILFKSRRIRSTSNP